MKGLKFIFLFLSFWIQISFSQSNSFKFLRVVNNKTNKPIGLSTIIYLRNDTVLLRGITNLDGELIVMDLSKPNSMNKFEIKVLAVGFKQENIKVDNKTNFPILIKLVSENGKNLSKKDVDFAPTKCIWPTIKESEKKKDTIIIND